MLGLLVMSHDALARQVFVCGCVYISTRWATRALHICSSFRVTSPHQLMYFVGVHFRYNKNIVKSFKPLRI